MKRQNLLLVLLFILGFNYQSQASHYMGGEITWECIPAGQPNAGKYIFTLKAFRDCSGITFGNSCVIYSNSPAGFFSINLLPGYPKDISPKCNSSLTGISCPTTTVPMSGGVSEYRYQSNPIVLTGVPPATGWVFYWSECCRNPSSNIVNANSLSWYIKATMYPYNNQNANPCFDNSPTFAEKPISVITAGYPVTYNHNAYDIEQDSLSYEWGSPLSTGGTAITTYQPGYSFSNPMPGLLQDSNNIPATLNPINGAISYLSYTSGSYVSSVQVHGFKNGTKVSTIQRDIQITIISPSQNNPPEVLAPFTNPNGSPSFTDTVYAGDLVSFNIIGYDTNILSNGSPQSVVLSATGSQFGSYIPATPIIPPTFSPTSGCSNPPCATLTPAATDAYPVSSQFQLSSNFSWQTSCNHITGQNGQGVVSNIYKFIAKISDDYCPVPGVNAVTYTIIVVDKPNLPSPIPSCISVLQNGDVVIDWQPITDSLGSFNKYLIYSSHSQNGPYSLLDSIDDVNANSYTHVNANGNNFSRFYKVETKCGCRIDNPASPAQMFRNMRLNVQSGLQNALLTWNSTGISANNLFYINELDANGFWYVTDSTTNNYYLDSFDSTNLPVAYRISLLKTGIVPDGFCFSYSNESYYLPNSIDNYFNESEVVVYPNPSNGDFNIDFGDISAEQNLKIEVFTADGLLVKKFETNRIANYSFNLAGRTGVFHMVITNESGKKLVKKLVKI